MDLYAVTQDWSAFFSALAQVSGGLMGLVFVGLTFRPEKLGVGGDPMLGELARITFSDFLVLLMISLMMLVPHVTAPNYGAVFVFMGATALWRVLAALRRLRAHPDPDAHSWMAARRFLPSIAGHALNLLAGLSLLVGKLNFELTASVLTTAIALLLLSACLSAWLLVMPERG